jgi:hypothetical protein
MVDYAPGAPYYANQSVVLYAVWRANSGPTNVTYAISYDPYGGTGSIAGHSQDHGD